MCWIFSLYFQTNPLRPSIHIQILQTGLYTLPLKNKLREFDKDQSIFPQVIILLILTTYSLHCVLILLRRELMFVTLGS